MVACCMKNIANREEAVIQATIAPTEIKTLADLRARLGGVALERIWFHPAHPALRPRRM